MNLHVSTSNRLMTPPERDRTKISVREVTMDDVCEVLGIPPERLVNFSIVRWCPWREEKSMLERSSVVWEVADQYNVSYLLCLKSFCQ